VAIVRIGPEGEREVIQPATPEEIVDAEAGLLKVIEALAKLAFEQEAASRRRPVTTLPEQE
jgi:hypothetical protein